MIILVIDETYMPASSKSALKFVLPHNGKTSLLWQLLLDFIAKENYKEKSTKKKS